MGRQRSAKQQLMSVGVRPSKERGQNFVINESVIDAIVDFGQPQSDERLVEIGPGLGALTGKLSKVAPVTAIEIETRFCEELRRVHPNVEVINSDFRSVDLATLGKDLTVFGNIPYVFSTDIIFHILEHAASVKRAVLLLQREFAERLASEPGGRDYGTISVAAQLRADIVLGPIISGDSFHPPTKVQSRVIEMKILREPRYAIGDSRWFQKVVKAAFFRRRKKLINSLKASGMFSGDIVERVLKDLQIDPGCRAETLAVEQFVRLAERFALAREAQRAVDEG